jgi:GNAT superfamily N-acetyltransferase
MYHGGEPQVDHDGPLWFSSDRKYAEGYATRDGRKARVWYVDIPEDHPLITPEYPEQGIKRGFTFNVELPGEIAKNRQVLDAPAPKKSRLGKGLADIKPTGGAEAVDRVAGQTTTVMPATRAWNLYERDPTVSDRLQFLDARQSKNETHIVTQSDGKVVGVAVLEQSPSDPGVLWVKGISVDEEHRRKGIAKALVGEVKKHAASSGKRLKLSDFTADGNKHLAKYFSEEAAKGQTSFLPGATTKEQIAAEAKAKEK